MMLLVDTNVLSQMRRPHLAPEAFRTWMLGVSVDTIWLSVMTLLELEVGTASAYRKDRAHGDALRRWIDVQILPNFAERLLPVDRSVVVRCATLTFDPTTRYADTLIAATALVHDLTVVTRNIRHFEPAGVRILDPFA
jgi:predicted nucleic acid-binding protein